MKYPNLLNVFLVFGLSVMVRNVNSARKVFIGNLTMDKTVIFNTIIKQSILFFIYICFKPLILDNITGNSLIYKTATLWPGNQRWSSSIPIHRDRSIFPIHRMYPCLYYSCSCAVELILVRKCPIRTREYQILYNRYLKLNIVPFVHSHKCQGIVPILYVFSSRGTLMVKACLTNKNIFNTWKKMSIVTRELNW